MENHSNYQKRGMWVLVLGIVMAGSVLFHMETGRAKSIQPSVEYIGEMSKREPRHRAPSSFPASQKNITNRKHL
jgi:hypothetical protein